MAAIIKRRTAKERLELDRALDAHLAAGGTAKAFAFDYGVGTPWVYYRAPLLGWGLCYVRKDEKARLLARRRYQIADPFKHAA